MPSFKEVLEQAQHDSGVSSPFVSEILFSPKNEHDAIDALFQHWIVDLYMMKIVRGIPIDKLAREMQLLLADYTFPS